MPKRVPPATPPTSRPPTKVKSPAFADPRPTPDPTTFVVKHPSDAPFYAKIDAFNAKHGIQPLKFPAPRGGVEPQLTLAQVLGNNAQIVNTIQASGELVFHALGDCGNTTGPASQNEVVDKMLGDFDEVTNTGIPQFHLLLGDVVYSFGETKYYYDQFYAPYRDYPAPILAAAGNHDGMAPPDVNAPALEGYLRNFCAQDFEVMPEAGGLSRTAQIQPGVFFTLEAPFVTILVLYSNALEDPGVIADATGSPSVIGTAQLAFLEAALTRLKRTQYKGAILLAHHHPPYTLAKHGWSVQMQQQIDAVCAKVGLWPHADLAGHAHNYQRFTRHRSDGTEIPYVVCGNGGHAPLQRLNKANGGVTLRAPQVIQNANPKAASLPPSPLNDQVVFENYDDASYGYLRVIVNAQQLRIEYHPASDGTEVKTPDDFVTIDLATRKRVQFVAPALGRPQQAQAVAATAATAEAQGSAKSSAAKRAKKASARPTKRKK